MLCGLYHELNSEYYGKETVIDSDIDHEWERIPHFYMQFYVYQYATGFSAAMAIARRILAGDPETKEGYFRFLKGGCSRTPVELLKLVGLDMEEPVRTDAVRTERYQNVNHCSKYAGLLSSCSLSIMKSGCSVCREK